MSHTSPVPGSTNVAVPLSQSVSVAHRSGFMSCIRRWALLAGVATLLCFSVPGDVKAEQWVQWWVAGDDDDNYTAIFILRDTEHPGAVILVYHYKNGTEEAYGIYPNPDPGGTSSGPKGDRQSQIALAKQHGGKLVSEQEFWDSPLGQMLTAKGKGPGAVINPGDDDPRGGPAAPSQAALKAMKSLGKGDPGLVGQKLGDGLIIDKTGAIGSGEGGFDFNAGSPADQLKQPGGPGGPPGGGGGSDDDDDKGSDKPPPGSNFGPAELVDPLGPPIAKSAKKTGNVRLGALGGPDTKSARHALGGPDTKSAKQKPGENVLPYGQQKSLQKAMQETRKQDTRGIRLGVNAFDAARCKDRHGQFRLERQSERTGGAWAPGNEQRIRRARSVRLGRAPGRDLGHPWSSLRKTLTRNQRAPISMARAVYSTFRAHLPDMRARLAADDAVVALPMAAASFPAVQHLSELERWPGLRTALRGNHHSAVKAWLAPLAQRT